MQLTVKEPAGFCLDVVGPKINIFEAITYKSLVFGICVVCTHALFLGNCNYEGHEQQKFQNFFLSLPRVFGPSHGTWKTPLADYQR